MKEKIIGSFFGLLYRLWSLTFRYELHFPSEETKELFYQTFNDPQSPVIYALWHQDENSLFPFFKRKKIVVVVSQSKDGQMIASALHVFGFKTVRGSSTRGGTGAFMGLMKEVMRNRSSTAFTVDGPKGPIYEAKEGVIRLSQKTKTPIVPLRARPERCYSFDKSWSKTRVPYPFSKVHLYVGEIKIYEREELNLELRKH